MVLKWFRRKVVFSMTIEEMKQKKRELGYSNAMIAQISGVPLGTVQKIFSGTTTADWEKRSFPTLLPAAPSPFRKSDRESIRWRTIMPCRTTREQN